MNGGSRAYGGMPALRGLEITAGVFSNIEAETKFGHVMLGTNLVTIWPPATVYSYPSGATAMTISSSDVDDDDGDTGARTARVTGLNEAGVEVKQTMTLDGQTGVSIPTPLLRVYRIEILTAGGSETNEGTIWVGSGTVSSGVPANKFATIEPGKAQTLQTPYTIPAGKRGYITAIYASLGGAKDLDLQILTRLPGEVFRVRRQDHLRSGVLMLQLDLPINNLPALTDIELRGHLDATTIEVGAAYDIVLIDT